MFLYWILGSICTINSQKYIFKEIIKNLKIDLEIIYKKFIKIFIELPL